MFDFIKKVLEEIKEQQRQAIARAQASANPAAQFAAPGGTRSKKKKKKGPQQEEAAAPQPQKPARRQAPAEEEPPVVTSAVSPAAGLNGRDPRKLFVWGEIIGPPLALREDDQRLD